MHDNQLTIDGLKDAIQVAKDLRQEAVKFNATARAAADDLRFVKEHWPSTFTAASLGFVLGVATAVLFQWRRKP